MLMPWIRGPPLHRARVGALPYQGLPQAPLVLRVPVSLPLIQSGPNLPLAPPAPLHSMYLPATHDSCSLLPRNALHPHLLIPRRLSVIEHLLPSFCACIFTNLRHWCQTHRPCLAHGALVTTELGERRHRPRPPTGSCEVAPDRWQPLGVQPCPPGLAPQPTDSVTGRYAALMPLDVLTTPVLLSVHSCRPQRPGFEGNKGHFHFSSTASPAGRHPCSTDSSTLHPTPQIPNVPWMRSESIPWSPTNSRPCWEVPHL